MDIEVIKIAPEALEQARAIRNEVFVKGQGVPQSLESENDETAVHFLAIADGLPAGASRYRKTGDGIKFERIAVLEAFRGQKIGDALVKNMLREVPPGTAVYLYAQIAATSLYARNGFEKTGNEFMEANIRHIKMVRQPVTDARV